MEIRKERTWCPTCTAPLVMEENLETIEIFLQGLPSWRTTGMDRITEGFDRAEILALMEMRGTNDRPIVWAAISEMEGELARIRILKKQEAPKPSPTRRARG